MTTSSHDTAATSFAVTIGSDGEPDTISISGDLNLHSVAQLPAAAKALIDDGGPVCFDLEGLTFIDSCGMGFFVRMYRDALDDKVRFTLRRPSDRVFRAFEMAALDRVLPWE